MGIPARLLTQRIAILRRATAGGPGDDWGHDAQANEAVSTDNVPAYIRLLSGQQAPEIGPDVATHEVFLPIGTDVKISDWIRTAPDDGRRFDVIEVHSPGPFPHHLEAVCKLVA